MKKEIPATHIWVYKKLLEKNSSYLRTNVILEVLKRTFYQLPRSMHYQTINEMEDYGLIKKINTKIYMILHTHEKLVKRANPPFFLFNW